MSKFTLIVTLLLVTSGCTPEAANTEKNKGWLERGTTEEKFRKVSKHLRGFDMAMAETGYRYIELYWGGNDQNWGYAGYQVKKIETAIKNGLERRPKRAASAKMIFPVIDQVKESILQEDYQMFTSNFKTLTQTCNACHSAESVSFIKVRTPTFRLSPVRFGEKK